MRIDAVGQRLLRRLIAVSDEAVLVVQATLWCGGWHARDGGGGKTNGREVEWLKSNVWRGGTLQAIRKHCILELYAINISQ